MAISKKGLWVIISILTALLLVESCIYRHEIVWTSLYYKNKIVKIYDDYKNRKEAPKALEKFLSADIKPKSVIIFEFNAHHHECMPGYAKYFTDLGYNVDVLIKSGCENALELFEPKDKLRIFTFNNIDQVSYLSSEISGKFSKYDAALLESTESYHREKELIEKLGFFSNPKSLFVTHDTEFIHDMGIEDYYVFVLGDFSKGLYVNPHYFSEFPVHIKNKKTRFFITSTAGRSYGKLVESAKKLKNSGLDFEVVVVGRSDIFSKERIPKELSNNFIFKQHIPYTEMYKEAQNSDYIIIPLEAENNDDNIFKTRRVTGSAQLAYGFSKPVIISEDFADFYKFNSETAFIYGEDKSLTKAMTEAINTSSKSYSKMSANVTALAKKIYETSLNNVKKALAK